MDPVDVVERDVGGGVNSKEILGCPRLAIGVDGLKMKEGLLKWMEESIVDERKDGW